MLGGWNISDFWSRQIYDTPFESRDRFATPPSKVEKNMRPLLLPKKQKCLICPVMYIKKFGNTFATKFRPPSKTCEKFNHLSKKN